jgi:hypothetical protein
MTPNTIIQGDARKLNRNFVGIELNPESIKLAEKRLRDELGMFL